MNKNTDLKSTEFILFPSFRLHHRHFLFGKGSCFFSCFYYLQIHASTFLFLFFSLFLTNIASFRVPATEEAVFLNSVVAIANFCASGGAWMGNQLLPCGTVYCTSLSLAAIEHFVSQSPTAFIENGLSVALEQQRNVLVDLGSQVTVSQLFWVVYLQVQLEDVLNLG